jgi:hypothetical protein
MSGRCARLFTSKKRTLVKASLPCVHKGTHVGVQGSPHHAFSVRHQQHPHVKLHHALNLLPAVHHLIYSSVLLGGVSSLQILDSTALSLQPSL